MSYTIQYGPEFTKRYPTKRMKKHSSTVIVVGIVLLMVAYIAVRTNIINILIPGDEAVTAAALSGLVESVESGNSVKIAMLNFCREIIAHGT